MSSVFDTEKVKYILGANGVSVVKVEGVNLIFDGKVRITTDNFSGSNAASWASERIGRKEAAEFFWAAAHLIDPEKRWEADKYPGIDYEK